MTWFIWWVAAIAVGWLVAAAICLPVLYFLLVVNEAQHRRDEERGL
jgi:hypothetical protein